MPSLRHKRTRPPFPAPSPKAGGPEELLGAYVEAERLGLRQGALNGTQDLCAEAYGDGCPYSPFATLRTIAGKGFGRRVSTTQGLNMMS